MKKLQLFLISLILLFILNCSSSEGKSSSVESGEPLVKPLVTFIELGSVRCIPCRMMQPVMKKVEERFKGKVKVVFYDVWTEEHAPMARYYGIDLIPTQIFLDQDGKEFFRHEGFFPFEEIEKLLKKRGIE